MKRRPMCLLLAGGAVGVLLLLAGCDTPSKQRWLTFFFDGVPPADSGAAATAEPIVEVETNQAVAVASVKPGPVLHPPYRERQCNACHESVYSQKLRGRRDEICLSCHKGLLAKLPQRHAPAEAGDCLVCHHPHQSPEKHLLLRAGQDLCGECHERADWADIPAHATIGDAACQTCHNPHGGAARFYLVADAPPPVSDAGPRDAP